MYLQTAVWALRGTSSRSHHVHHHFRCLGALSLLMAEDHLLADVWEQHTWGAQGAFLLSFLHPQPGSVPFLSQRVCAQDWQAVGCRGHVSLHADLLRPSKVLFSELGCFWSDVHVFGLCGWQYIGLGFSLGCSQNVKGRICPCCNVQSCCGVAPELNLECFVLCVFSN